MINRTCIVIVLFSSLVRGGDLIDAMDRYEQSQPAKKPVVIGHSIRGCVPCLKAKQWTDMPFDIQWVNNSTVADDHPGSGYPIFEFQYAADGKMWRHWNKNQQQLVDIWLEKAADAPEQASDESVALCKCAGSNKSVCLCLKEIRAGLRTKPCGCSKTKASEHKMKNGKPIGATGRYVDPTTSAIRSKPKTAC